MNREKLIQEIKLIDSKFIDLMEELKKIFSDEEIKTVHDFLDFGEYGISLDIIVGTFIERKKIASPEVIKLINDLLEIMNLDPGIYHSVEDSKLLVSKK